MLADRMRRHSVEHAKEIAQQYFYREAYKELSRAAAPRKRPLGQADVQVMMGPRVSADPQIVEFLEVAVEPGEVFAGVAWQVDACLAWYDLVVTTLLNHSGRSGPQVSCQHALRPHRHGASEIRSLLAEHGWSWQRIVHERVGAGRGADTSSLVPHLHQLGAAASLSQGP